MLALRSPVCGGYVSPDQDWTYRTCTTDDQLGKPYQAIGAFSRPFSHSHRPEIGNICKPQASSHEHSLTGMHTAGGLRHILDGRGHTI